MIFIKQKIVIGTVATVLLFLSVADANAAGWLQDIVQPLASESVRTVPARSICYASPEKVREKTHVHPRYTYHMEGYHGHKCWYPDIARYERREHVAAVTLPRTPAPVEKPHVTSTAPTQPQPHATSTAPTQPQPHATTGIAPTQPQPRVATRSISVPSYLSAQNNPLVPDKVTPQQIIDNVFSQLGMR